MKIIYSIPLQTVTFEWTTEEQHALVGELKDKVRATFKDFVHDLKSIGKGTDAN